MRSKLEDLRASTSEILARVADFCRRYNLLAVLATAYVCSFFFFNDDVIPRQIYYYVVLPIALLLALPFAARVARRSMIFWAAAAYLFFIALAWFGQPDIPVSRLVDHARKSVLILSFLIVIAYLASEREQFLRRFILVVGLAASANILANMLVYYSGVPSLEFSTDVRLLATIGMPGYGNSNSIALTYAVLWLAVVTTLVSNGPSFLERAGLFPSAIVLLVALITTQSRGAFLAASCGLFVLLLGPVSWRARIVMMFGVAAAGVAAIMISPVREAMLARALSYRPDAWRRYLEKAAEQPWLGYGIWSDISIPLTHEITILHPHNIMLSAQIRGGIFAALAMATLLGCALFCAFRAWQRSTIILPLVLAVALIVGTSVDHEILTTATAWPWVTFWVPIAICIAAELRVRDQTSTSEVPA